MQLGDLEKKVMDYIWQHLSDDSFTVRDVVDGLHSQQEEYAYNTILTVVTHLQKKGLLTRTKRGKRGVYTVKQTKEEFIQQLSSNFMQQLQQEYGDLALAQFVNAVEEIDPVILERAKQAKYE